MIGLLTLNKLMMKIAITLLVPLPKPSSSLQVKQIHMYGLDEAHREIPITP